MNPQLLKSKSYKALISAQTVSNLGDWLYILGLMALVGIKWHGSPLEVSLAMLMMSLPSILFGSLAGTLADRMDRKFLMVLSDLTRAAIMVGIVVASQLFEVYLLVALLSLFSTLFEPAKQGKLKEIVAEELLQSAVSTSQLINNGAKIVGPIIGGALIAITSVTWAFYIDACSFLVSALCLTFLPKTERFSQTKETPNETKTSKSSFVHQLAEGFRFLKTTPTLLVGVVMFSLVMFVLQISDSQFIVLFREIHGSSINILGWLMAGSGLGVVLASIYLNKKEITSFIGLLAISSVVLGLGYMGITAGIHMPITMIEILYPIGGVVVGFCFGLSLIPFEVMVQKQTPEQFTGRVFGTIGSLTTLSVILGTSTGGVLSQFFGVHLTYYLAGGLLVLVGLVVYSKRKSLERGNRNAQGEPGTLQETAGRNS
ncbi:MFS transporter [Pullulanibacillus sp. KACC 23026]|uniref:MFS transporter n=1 Tax=Pullulanibacillus sp. KACC 23026 TaxID=3028315 RepID=UPI0023B0205B|nr:MFS transporter [Pullulanibacillus sp. KACC 23026]WEG11778.1 MFS transporter [Pullulanibacillus sp. KACC 23026]